MMWELISSNRRKSFILFMLLGTCLILLGYLVGNYYYPDGGGAFGIVMAAALWFILSLVAYFQGGDILLASSGAKEVSRETDVRLFNVIEEVKIAAGLPMMPKTYIIESDALNAFAVGRNPREAAIAVTSGLLQKLDRDELQGVIAHEMSHIVNRDSLYMTFAGVTLGAITLISSIFWRGQLWGGGRIRSRSRVGGSATAILMLLTIVFVIVGAFLARLLYFAISRRREYLADASAVRLTRYPEGLASALEKIQLSAEPLATANKATAPLLIANPFMGDGDTKFNWQSTHPPLSERISILRQMSMGAGYLAYEDAFSHIRGGAIIPKSALKKDEKVEIRRSSAANLTGNEDYHRLSGDSGTVALTLRCACGNSVQVPADLSASETICPSCGHLFKLTP